MSDRSFDGETDSDRERQLDEAVAAYLAAMADGKLPNRQEWLAQHPELRGDLVEFLEDLDRMNSAVGAEQMSAATSNNVDGKGSIIGNRYTLIEQIGEGGMGEVWVARQTDPVWRRVAVKLVKAGMDSKAVLARFEAERQALALMDHPNIAKILDGGLTASQRPYFVMELVNGLHLTRFCDQASLPIRDRIELFLPICHAVQHAHQKGIVHRDLKPSNILVTHVDGVPMPKVIDFGVAKATIGRRIEESTLTQFGGVVGTLEYMPPEQAGYHAGDVDTRADVYALGVILYELLTGLRPFDARRLKQAAFDEMVRTIREQEPSKPSTRLSSDESLPSVAAVRRIEPSKLTKMLQGDLDWVVMKCLEKQRDRRYQTANGLARDLQRYLTDETVEARPPTRWYRCQKFVQRNRGLVLGLSLIITTVLLGVVATSMGLIRALRSERLATSETIRAEAVRDFLTDDLLGQANPELNDRSAKVTVEELLNRAWERIDTSEKLANQPEAKAEILAVMGKSYQELGNYKKAVDCWQRAIELNRQLGRHDHDRRTIAALQGFGQALLGVDRFADAEASLRKAVALQTQTVGSENSETLFAVNNLALALAEQGRFEEAEKLLKSNWETRSRVFGQHDQDTLQALVNYAGLLTQKGDYVQADTLFQTALDGFRKSGRSDSPIALNSENAWALNLTHERKLNEAKLAFLNLIERKSRVLGANHLLTLGSRTNLGYVLSQLGETDAALQQLSTAYDGLKSDYGPTHHETLAAKNSIVLAMRDAQRWEEAEQLAKELIDEAKTVVGPSQIDLVVYTNNLGWIYEGQQKYDDAERAYRASLAIAETAGHRDDPLSLDSAHNLTRVLFKQKKFEAAAQQARQTYDARCRILPANHPSTMATAQGLVDSLMQLERFETAESLLRGILMGRENPLPESMLANLWFQVGQLCLRQQKFREASDPLQQALDIQRRIAPDSPNNAAIQAALDKANAASND